MKTRRLSIIRINASSRLLGLKYSKLRSHLYKQQILINNSILAELSNKECKTFKAIVVSVHENNIST